MGQRVPDLPRAVAEWLDNAPDLPAEFVPGIEQAFAGDPDAYLAGLYTGLVRPRNRRRLGTFFTPSPEVALMMSMWEEHANPPRSVIDVGAGVGVFTAAAARRWPESTISAVDVNPVTLGLLAARLYGPGQSFKNVQLVHRDFTTWLKEDGDLLKGPRLILGNPPYTRAQLLPVDDRRRLQAQTFGLCGSRASLSAIITAIALLSLREDDGLCLLLPAQWLEAQYAADLRRRLWENSRRRIELRLVASALFEDATVDAVILQVTPQTNRGGIFVSRWDTSTATPSERVDTARSHTSWRALFETEVDCSPGPPRDGAAVNAGFVEWESSSQVLADIAVVRRGVATGANTYFVLDEIKRKELQLSPWSRRRIVTTLRHYPPDVKSVDDQVVTPRSWLLEAPKGEVLENTALARYIAQGDTDELPQRVLCSRRADWFDLRAEVVVPDVIIGPMSRDQFRVVTNDISATITNNLYGLTWLPETTDAVREAFLAWLRSTTGQRALRSIARNQGDGLLKIEPRALQLLPLPRFHQGNATFPLA